jgi:hypothetical protein
VKPNVQSNGFFADRLMILGFAIMLVIFGMIKPMATLECLVETFTDGDIP